jgi:hypothetical protein
MMPVSAALKITFWPELRNASDVAILTEERSYDASAESYCATACASFPKCLTASKLSRLSTATVAARLSAWLASRRKRVLGQDQHQQRVAYTVANLQEVVRTVNQVYAPIVARVIAAKFHPKLYVCHTISLAQFQVDKL